MLEIIFKSIPKATNEFIFVLGVLGLCVLLFRRRKSAYIYFVFLTAVAMIVWRASYGIMSGRYASCLIYLFSISAAFFISSLIRFHNILCRISVILIGIGLISNMAYKDFNTTGINSNLEILAQLHDRLNNNMDSCVLVTNIFQAQRIKRIEKQKNLFELYYGDRTIKDAEEYIKRYSFINRIALFNIALKAKNKGEINIKSERSRYQHILSIFSQKNKSERHHVYKIESKKIELVSLPPDKDIKPESGILRNGDLELLDSPEESYKKLKNHIGDYSRYFNYDESRRTPINAYFHNAPVHTNSLLYYSCLNNKAISGKNSARIVSPKNEGYLLFYQKFHSGTYQYSVTFSGNPKTTVCVLYDLFSKNRWHVTPLATYTILDKKPFQIETTFSVPDLNPGEYFLVGAWVKGEAFIDNFCLKRNDK